MSNLIPILRSFASYFRELQDEESKQISKNGLVHFLLIFGSTYLVFLFLIIFFSAAAFALNQPNSTLQIGLGSLISLIFCFLGCKTYFSKSYFLIAPILWFLIVGLFVIACLTSGQFYDLSYDGQSYHQDIILKLAEGWNPFYQHLTTRDLPTAGILNYYPKTAEIYETALYKLTNQIEYSKAFNFILAYVAFALSLAVLLSLKKINNFMAVAVSLLLAFNPISIVQFFSFYIDGQVYQLLLCLIAISALIYYDRKSFILIPFFCAIALLVTIKITALVYMAVFVGLLLTFSWYSEKIHLSTRVFLTSVLAVVTAFFFLGFNPFLTNAYFYGHPLHPALGNYALDYVQINGPENFQNKPSIVLLFYSIFSESDFLKGQGKFAQLKPPLVITNREKQAFVSTDPIEGGFGPLFSGAIIVTAALFLYTLLLFRKSPLTQLLSALAVLILITCILNAASFYARFIPQFWFIPILAIILGYSLKSFITRLLAGIIFGLLILNNVFIAQVNWGYNIEASNQMHQQLKLLAEASQKQPLQINFGIFESNRVRFKEASIVFVEQKEGLSCINKKRLLGQLIPESVIVSCATPYPKMGEF